MILTEIRINNLYCFDDFYVDFSYPRKVIESTIDYEFLEERPKFNIKRFCVIMGTNSSGKTALGKVLFGIENFIVRKELSDYLKTGISDNKKDASIEVKFVTTSDLKFHSLNLDFSSDSVFPIKALTYKAVPILQNDSCLSCKKRIDAVSQDIRSKKYTYISSVKDSIMNAYDAFSKIEFASDSWDFRLGNNLDCHEDLCNKEYHPSRNLLERIIKTYDQSVNNVTTITASTKGTVEGYLVEFENGDTVRLNKRAEVFPEDHARLSKGTSEALNLVTFIANILKQGSDSCTYYLDDSLSSTDSEIEKDLINLMISKLKNSSQLFYTTHNNEFLTLNIPTHSFLFLSKKGNFVEAFQPEKMSFNKNDRTLFSYAKNNMFGTVPDTDGILEILLNENFKLE
ncbi:MAG: ATP-binding protein [Succinivibrio sp.]|jgi:hypothetical protein|nr:ATP-binding protein [Succinivibrio sp.]